MASVRSRSRESAPYRPWPLLTALAIGAVPSDTPAADWVYASGTQAGLKYSELAQIDRTNVEQLQVAWTYRTGELERRGPSHARMQSFQATPVLVDGALVLCTAFARVIALDPATGAERWVFDPNPPGEPRGALLPKCRGVSPWIDPQALPGTPCRRRLLFGTWDFKVHAIDAATGRRCRDFGNNGEVRLDPGKPMVLTHELQITSPPAIAGDLAIFGSVVADAVRHDAPSGKVRALDARTGSLRWEFDPIPRDPADPAARTWGGDSARVTGHANVWSLMAVDEQRGLVFLPTSSPSPDYYGGLRPGENRYANSLVALRAATGELVWHFQITHHDLWDYDLPAQPLLVDVPRDGRTVPAVVQLTKQGLVFVFNRETGEPLFPIEERPVPAGALPGEWLSPTQPFPAAPPPLVALGLEPEDAWGFTPLDRWSCRRRIAKLRHGSIYTPPSLEGTVTMPSAGGGANWGGGAIDPRRQLLIVNTMHIATVTRLRPSSRADAGWREAYENLSLERQVAMPQLGTPYAVEFDLLTSPLGVPCTEPPWGRLTAVDLGRGTIRWQVALGTLEKLLPVPVPLALGTPNAGGAIVTAGGLVFIAASLDDQFRAFDVDTGAQLWQAALPAGGQATPMTYAIGGRQYVVIAAGGHAFLGGTPGDYVVAFALPQGDARDAGR